MDLSLSFTCRSPAMAGGLFAIERDFFFELGLYDPGLQIWGGENFEISYKVDMAVLFLHSETEWPPRSSHHEGLQ